MERFWTKNYQNGVPAFIDPSAYRSLVDIFLEACEKYKDKTAFVSLGSSLSYSEIEIQSRYFAAYLQQECHFKKGDRLALMMPNVFQYVIALLGGMRAGMVIVNVNPLYTSPEILRVLKDSNAVGIVILANSIKTLEEVVSQTSLRHTIVTEVGDLLSFPKNKIVNFWLKYVERQVPSWHVEHAQSFNTALKAGANLNFQPCYLVGEDIAFLQYTGGTTGTPKAAILTHRNMIANVLQASAWITPTLREGEEIVVTPLPLYHIFSLLANLLLFIKWGAINILIPDPRDLKQLVNAIKNYKFTAITGVNTLFNVLGNYPAFAKLDFTALKISLGGGMAMQHATAEKWKEVTGCVLTQAYGLTEASPAVSINPFDLKEFNGSVGLPIPSTDISIRNEKEEAVAINQVGEVWVKGPQIMRGYWQNPLESHEVITEDGWLKTGDMGYLDSEGFLYLVDRKKDLIIVSGFNVYPVEIEDVIASHPKVAEVGVVGVSVPVHGESIKAFVVKRDPSLTKEELLAYCHERLTGYKIPREIEFVDTLPKTYLGKILHRALRKEGNKSS